MDAIKGLRKRAVGVEKAVAADELTRTVEVGHLEVASRRRIANIAECQETARDNRVEQLLHELAVGHALGQVVGSNPGAFECGVDPRTKLFPERVFRVPHRGTQQQFEARSILPG